MMNLQGLEEELERSLVLGEPEQGPKVNIPWEKIDEWIASLDSKSDEGGEVKVVDPGDRRN